MCLLLGKTNNKGRTFSIHETLINAPLYVRVVYFIRPSQQAASPFWGLYPAANTPSPVCTTVVSSIGNQSFKFVMLIVLLAISIGIGAGGGAGKLYMLSTSFVKKYKIKLEYGM